VVNAVAASDITAQLVTSSARVPARKRPARAQTQLRRPPLLQSGYCRPRAQTKGVRFIGAAMLRHSRNAREFFRTDFLAPLAAAALFPDLLQRLLPFPVTQFDRARGLESAFTAKAADIWGNSSPGNPFAKSVHRLWDPEGAAPALLLNTTSIEMGARVTISRFSSE
jgi:hypothetical protein